MWEHHNHQYWGYDPLLVKKKTQNNNFNTDYIFRLFTDSYDISYAKSHKTKGDGYFSQPDGVHTVAYQVNGTLTGSIKMQGSLATTPTEDDFFDIAGTTFTADQSTLISTANFTGNFVWIRAKATSVTAGTISSVLVNS